MIRNFGIIFLLLLISTSLTPALGVIENIATNKSLYHDGDLIIISGNVVYDSAFPSITIQILNPILSDLAGVAFTLVNPDGSFLSDSIRTGGVQWTSDGTYTIKVIYDEIKEKTIEYQEFSESTQPEPTSEPTTKSQANTSENQEHVSAFNTLKLTIPNFPALDKSPQYYIDRYNDESSYKSWFDSQFTNNSITDVVGYKSTHVDNFPALDKSPQYYIDRYNDESSYKSWFDSQFTNSSIYNILGYEDPVSVPEWIRDYAEWWAIGDVDDSQFVAGLEFMLENNIIMVSGVSSSGNSSTNEIPDWVRNNAHWWSQDLISEDDFINSLEYLIREGIITIN